jgi:hypothetical protein
MRNNKTIRQDNNMLKLLNLSLFLIIVIFFSCEKQGLIVKCPDCTKEEPLNIQLELLLDESTYGYATNIDVYVVNIEDSILYSSVSTSWTKTTLPVTINKKYTVVAKYYYYLDYYFVVDSATPRVKYDKDQCEEPCYFVYDRTLDLRLKRTK